MSRRDVTLLILDGDKTTEIKVRKGIIKNFNLIVLGIVLFIICLVVALFFFIYNYSYTQFIATENQRLLIKNYELSQKVVSLNNSIENAIGNRINKLDRANTLIDSIRKYLKDKGAQADQKLKQLADSSQNKDYIKVGDSHLLKVEKPLYNEQQLTYLLEEIQSVPLGFPHQGRMTSGFGERIHPITRAISMHEGIDLSGVIGAPVKSTASGIVVFAGRNRGYGNVIKIQHEHGYMTVYAHLSKIQVSDGQLVHAGDIIGNLGDTGRSTGPHLHYEVRYNNMPVNPTSYLSLEH
ncbi:MAG: hypothetical protein DI619_00860 [Francisella sp.]|jgi:putative lipoprotein|nr:MAG: hypothetical protein DI619_00860 [Francisella sp.]